MSLLPRCRVWLRKRVSSHYSEDVLVAFFDGEVSPSRAKKIAGHLETCAACRCSAALLEGDLRAFSEIDAALIHDQLASDDNLYSLQKAIRSWNSANFAGAAAVGSRTAEPAVLGPEICGEVKVYLGAHALDLILQESVRKAYSQSKLLESVETILQNFLGRRAGDALISSLLTSAAPKRGQELGTLWPHASQ